MLKTSNWFITVAITKTHEAATAYRLENINGEQVGKGPGRENPWLFVSEMMEMICQYWRVIYTKHGLYRKFDGYKRDMYTVID